MSTESLDSLFSVATADFGLLKLGTLVQLMDVCVSVCMTVIIVLLCRAHLKISYIVTTC